LIQNSPSDPYHRDPINTFVFKNYGKIQYEFFLEYDISNEQLVILINDDIFDIKPSNVLRRYKALLSILLKRVDQYSVEDPYDL